MTLFTIGFTRASAETFFEKLITAGVRTLIDIRLNNTSQLAGFAKRDDLAYFLKKIGGIEYVHYPHWAPTADILDNYKKKVITWDQYEERFLSLIQSRGIETEVLPSILNSGCLLCSEPKPDKCHRRLVAEYLQHHIPDLAVCHL